MDGGQHLEQSDDDARRTQWFEDEGFRVLRFWNNEVLTNLNGVKETIYKALMTSQPPSPALPHMEGGCSIETPSLLVGEVAKAAGDPPDVWRGRDGGIQIMFKKIQRIHFVGIGGSGMSGIAEVLVNLGYQVSGSDLKRRQSRIGWRKSAPKF